MMTRIYIFYAPGQGEYFERGRLRQKIFWLEW